MLRTMRNHTKTIMIIVILFFIASCFAGYGLYVRGGGGKGEGMRDYAVARINGHDVMRSELERGTASLAEQLGRDVAPEDIPQIRKSAIDNMAVDAEIEKEIQNRKIEAASQEIDEAYRRMMDSYPTREEFLAYMKRSGVTEKQMKENISRQIRVQKLMESVGEGITVEDGEVSAFYDATKNFLYKQPAGIKADIASFRKEESAEAARKEIAEGGKWDEVMEKYRADIETATPHDKPALLTDQMLQKELAFIKDLPVGEISPVKKANPPFAFIAISRGREAERMLSFDEVKEDVRESIRVQKMQEKQQQFYDELLARADIKILDPEIFPQEKAPEQGKPGEGAQNDAAAPASGGAPADKAEPASGVKTENTAAPASGVNTEDAAAPASGSAPADKAAPASGGKTENAEAPASGGGQ